MCLSDEFRVLPVVGKQHSNPTVAPSEGFISRKRIYFLILVYILHVSTGTDGSNPDSDVCI